METRDEKAWIRRKNNKIHLGDYMAHYQQRMFLEKVRRAYPNYFIGKKVLDVGSLDINGSNKDLFMNCDYLGIDVADGRNVDLVTPAHKLDVPDETFDVVISSECFEHDMYYKESLLNIFRVLKKGGMFLFTCATTGRPEHGTRRTSPQDAPLLQGMDEWQDYYKNLEEKDIVEVLDMSLFMRHKFEIGHQTCDLYFWGIKKF